MSDNLIMLDFASNDPRSVPAMLRGIGDGRERSWQSFEIAHPSLSQEEIMEIFRLEAQYGRIKIKNKLVTISARKMGVILVSLAIILA